MQTSRGRGLLLLLGVAACSSLPGLRRPAVEFWGFSAPWDARSAASVAAHASQLDAVVSGWIALDTLTGIPRMLFGDSVSRADGRRRMALVTSWSGDRFHPAVIRSLAVNPELLARVAGEVATLATRGGYRGIIVDFEGHASSDRTALAHVVRSIGDSARARGAGPIVVAVPAADTAAYSARVLGGSADFILVMLYDEHWSTSVPGPIASPDWARRHLAVRIGEVGPGRIVASLPLHGYRWRRGGVTQVIGYDAARQLATSAGVPLRRDQSSRTLRARGDGADPWELWVSDAELLRELVSDARSAGVTRFAFFRLGLEDPEVWTRVVQPNRAP